MTANQSTRNISPDASAILAERHLLLIDGKWANAQSEREFAVLDPSTGAQIATVAEGGAEDIDRAVAAARRAFGRPSWSAMPATERAKLLWRLADLIDANAGVLAEVESIDNGIPITLSRYMALPLAAEILRYYAGWVTKLTGDTIPANSGAVQGAPTLTYTLREPVGVVGQIIPWNFPLGMAVLKIAPALATGCTIVLKPAELTPLTALMLGRLALEAGIPEGVLNIVPGFGNTAGAALCAHPDVDKIAFTGSTAVGRSVIGAATGNIKKVSLELGGKSPVVIFPDADLDLAIPGAAMAAFLLQGQNCMAGTRLFVHRDIYDHVVAGVAAVAKALAVGSSLDPATVIGPVISQAHRQRIQGYIDQGLKEGAELIAGGSSIDGPGFFVQPTVFARTNASMTVVREEIFGPVLCIDVFDDTNLDAIAQRANDSIYGLSGSVWTRDLSTAHTMAKKIRAGQVSINCHGAVDVSVPFGGYKQSGWGREYGEAALSLYTEIKAVTARL